MGAIGPKNRISKAARDKKRANYKLEQPALTKCAKCGELVLPHRVCKNCGTYKNRQVLATEEN